jgi:GNAT superfamily N-acetyltransferase
MSLSIKSLKQAISDNERITFIALVDGAVAGIADVAWSPLEDPSFGNLFVGEAHRCCGIGRALVQEAISWAATNGKSLWLHVQPGDWRSAWYVRCGFRETAECIEDSGHVWYFIPSPIGQDNV